MIPEVPAETGGRKGSIVSSTLLLTVSRVIGVGGQAATYVIAARRVHPTQFGVALTALAVAGSVIALADLGLTGYASRELAAGRCPPHRLRRLAESRFAATALAAGVWALCALPFDRVVLWVAVFLVAESSFSFFCALAIANAQIRLAAGASLVARVLPVAVIALAANLPLALAVGPAAGSVLLLLGSGDLFSRTDPMTATDRQPFLRAARAFFVTAQLTQAANLDTAIVGMVSGARTAAIYGLPSKLTSPLGTLTGAFSSLILPRSSRAHADSDDEEFERLVRSIWYFGGMSCAGLALLGLLAGVAVPAVVGHAYASSVGPLRVIIVAVAINSINQPLFALLTGAGFAGSIARLLIVSVPLGLAMVAIGSRLGGATLAGAGLVSMQSVELMRNLVLLRRHRRARA